MQYGQPPSWRPDHEQLKVEAYRGTVRDALGGLRNLEQLLGSLRVGPRALLSVLPDVQACCSPLADALSGSLAIVAERLPGAAAIVESLSQTAQTRLGQLESAFETIRQSTFNARARLKLEEQVVATSREVGAIVELIDLLGEVAWGRRMSISLTEVAREAFRSSEPPSAGKQSSSSRSSIRLSLSTDIPNTERDTCPRALVLILTQLVRLRTRDAPNLVPHVSFSLESDERVAIGIEAESQVGEVRWATGRHVLPETEACVRFAAETLGLGLELPADPSDALRLVFGTTSGAE